MIADHNEDKSIVLRQGERTYSRVLSIPMSTQPGLYKLLTEVWFGRNRGECCIDCLAATPSDYNNQNQMIELRPNRTMRPTAGQRDDQLEFMNTLSMLRKLGSASGS
jgi:hypothetical protein